MFTKQIVIHASICLADHCPPGSCSQRASITQRLIFLSINQHKAPSVRRALWVSARPPVNTYLFREKLFDFAACCSQHSALLYSIQKVTTGAHYRPVYEYVYMLYNLSGQSPGARKRLPGPQCETFPLTFLKSCCLISWFGSEGKKKKTPNCVSTKKNEL